MARGKIPGAPQPEPWKPSAWELEEAGAIQAVAYGKADEHQQQRAMKYIIEALCATYDMSFRAVNPHETSFAEGKRFVGLQLVKLINTNLSRLQGKPSEQG